MRIITYNVNGVRSALQKGLLQWLGSDPADIVCLQEIKALKENVDHAAVEALGYETYWFSAQKKGYSGVAVFTKIHPDKVEYGTGHPQSDAEGRVIRLDFGDRTLINAYFPSGTSGEERQKYKYQWLDEFGAYLEELQKERPRIIVCGDYNIAHREIDIHDPKGNKNSSGFLPEERAWMDKFFSDRFVDTFRHFNKDPHHYSWWTFRANARNNNKGWRIDYVNVTSPLREALAEARILPDIAHSDHCPVYLELTD
jgi:exodeoxyribonuclease-3